MTAWAPDPISNEDLAALGERMGCDFSSDARRRFLDRWESCDVQAAPGSGKTTLVVAKLVHLARNWRFTRQGVCVLSHTNVAREEIEGRVARIPEAGRVLAYPSFIGTLTSFFHTFLALPLLRGLGWPMSRVDDDLFAARCCAQLHTKPTIRSTPREGKARLTGWARNLTLAPDFELREGSPPASVRVGEQEGLYARTSRTRQELEELKAEICAEGIYRYDDMTVFAARALALAPNLAVRLAERFPLVVLDEAQDTAPQHLELITQIFGGERSCLQRIGDCNQAIFVGSDVGDAWTPADGCLDLGQSLRFGAQIATFASRLTCARKQDIVGEAAEDRPTFVMLISEGAEARVGRRFAELVASELEGAEDLDAWAVGCTHNLSVSDKALRLGTYFESYQPPQRSPNGEPTLLGALQKELSAVGHDHGHDLGSVVDAYAGQLRRLFATRYGRRELVSIRRIWQWLDEARLGSAHEARVVLRRIVKERGRVPASEWTSIAQQLRAALNPRLPADAASPALDTMLAHIDQENAGERGATTADTRSVDYEVEARRVRLRLGTIASVKGRTHDATLVVQTTNRSRVYDVRSALEVALGDRKRLEKPLVRHAVMNVFVASTRPRRLLCLALQSDKTLSKLRPKLEKLGVVVIEVQ